MSPDNKMNFTEEVLESISDAFLAINHDYEVTYINKAAEEFSGRKRDDVLGKNILEAFNRGKNTIFQEKIKLLKERKFFEFETNFDVPPFDNWYNVRVFPYEKGFNIFFQDITLLKKAEYASIHRENQWRNLISNLPGMVFRCRNDENWTMEFISHQCKAITGYMPSDFINNAEIAYNDIILHEDRENVWDIIQNALAKNESYEINYRITNKENEIRWVWERGLGVEDENGELFLEGFIEDVTDQRLAEDDLKNSEMRNRTILDKLPATIWMINKKLRFISGSRFGSKFTRHH